MYVICNILEGWYYTDMYRIMIQGCTDRMYLRCLRKRGYQMDIINNYWKYTVVTIIACTFGYGTLIGEVHGSVWPQYGHRLVLVLRLCCKGDHVIKAFNSSIVCPGCWHSVAYYQGNKQFVLWMLLLIICCYFTFVFVCGKCSNPLKPSG